MRPRVPAGYSGTPLVQKLGITGSTRLVLINAPESYADLVTLPPGAVVTARVSRSTTVVHVFSVKQTHLVRAIAGLRRQLSPEAVVWVSWPKKSAKVATDISEDRIREVALPLGFVDIKVCAFDATWSALKLVVRRALRSA